MDYAEPYRGPVQSAMGREGCGQSVKYADRLYFYRVGKLIPGNRPCLVSHEGMYLGRQNGEKEYLVIAWDGVGYAVLEQPGSGEAKTALLKYAGMTSREAVAKAKREAEKREAELAAMPRCDCGAVLLVFEDDQSDGECIDCYEKRKRT